MIFRDIKVMVTLPQESCLGHRIAETESVGKTPLMSKYRNKWLPKVKLFIRIMNVDRVESFRSSLMNQKQRLMKQTQVRKKHKFSFMRKSFLKAQNTFDKSVIEKDLKKSEEEKSAKTFIFGALRKISGGSRKSSKVSFLLLVF